MESLEDIVETDPLEATDTSAGGLYTVLRGPPLAAGCVFPRSARGILGGGRGPRLESCRRWAEGPGWAGILPDDVGGVSGNRAINASNFSSSASTEAVC